MKIIRPCFTQYVCSFLSSLLLFNPSSVWKSSTPCSQTLTVYVHPLTWETKWHPYKTAGKILILCALIYKFLDNRQEDVRFWTEWLQVFLEFNMHLILSWTIFSFLSLAMLTAILKMEAVCSSETQVHFRHAARHLCHRVLCNLGVCHCENLKCCTYIIEVQFSFSSGIGAEDGEWGLLCRLACMCCLFDETIQPCSRLFQKEPTRNSLKGCTYKK
jgi:hypothetical protein